MVSSPNLNRSFPLTGVSSNQAKAWPDGGAAGAKRILLDGRVFSSAAFDRGMGRYVAHVGNTLEDAGFHVVLLLFRNCYAALDQLPFDNIDVRFANFDPETFYHDEMDRIDEAQRFTTYLSTLIDIERIDYYIDSTPFLAPGRFDILPCPVITVCYDFIPLKYPDHYLGNQSSAAYYCNGLTRVLKADHIVSISETVGDEIQRYLGVAAERISVVSPRLEDIYVAPPAIDDLHAPYMFQILGAHQSKNPTLSILVHREMLDRTGLEVRVNAPKADQCDHLRVLGIDSDVVLTHSIDDLEKFGLQAGASVVCHLSLEEGFGIPLLEAVYLRKKVIALDIPMNREILGAGLPWMDGAVLLLSPDTESLDHDAVAAFLRQRPDRRFHDAVRLHYADHWAAARGKLEHAIVAADEAHERWTRNVDFEIMSSLPGTNCGVADYSLAYVRSAAPKNVVVLFSEGDDRYVNHLPHVRTVPARCFALTGKYLVGVPCLFNFAFSDALFPGIETMMMQARHGDVLLIHERYYARGLHHYIGAERMDAFLLDHSRQGGERARLLAETLAFGQAFNRRVPATAPFGYNTDWLDQLPVRFVHHLPPSVIEEMQIAVNGDDNGMSNDLSAIEADLEFAPLGIDPRGFPATSRAAQSLRRRRGIMPDDIVVGHFGLILDDIKRLREVAQAVTLKIVAAKLEGVIGRRIFFLMVGKVVDQALFDDIRRDFADAGIAARLIHANPAGEADFDAEIAACDAVFCLRRQLRGQLSHIFVRGLSMGVPMIVNQRSGYAYGSETTVRDDALTQDIGDIIDNLTEPQRRRDMRRTARGFYERQHRADDSLAQILKRKVA